MEAQREPAIDLRTLIHIFDADRGAIINLLGTALASIAESAADIVFTAESSDALAVIAAAHRLKGTGGTIGAAHLIELGARIEAGARRKPPTISPAILLELQSAVADVANDIAAYAQPPAEGGGF